MVVHRRARETGRVDELRRADRRRDRRARGSRRASDLRAPGRMRAAAPRSLRSGDARYAMSRDERCCARTSGSDGSRWGTRTTRSASGSGTYRYPVVTRSIATRAGCGGEHRGRCLLGGIELGGACRQRAGIRLRRLRRCAARVSDGSSVSRTPSEASGVAAVVARVREEPRRRRGVAARRRLDVVDPGKRAPRPGVAAEKVASELDGIHRLDGLDEPLRGEGRAGVERDAEEVEPRLALDVADLFESDPELAGELLPRAARRSGERHEQR